MLVNVSYIFLLKV